MQPEVKIWLLDIKISVEEIWDFLPGKRDFYSFQKDVKTRKAIERNIEIIGEALNRVLKVYPDIRISESRKIVDTRNRIIHGYDSVSADVVWLIINNYLPTLEKEIEALLEKA